jgi:hypothetical protein
MALVSPGSQITITDESQYVPGAVGTTALVLLATAQDKTNPAGALASDTTQATAGKLLSFTSQRDLITAMGYPTFEQSAAGTPLHGDERNEYGLIAAYSALGQSNLLYAIRADIDLNELTPTAVRPTGTVADGIVWLDTADSNWGIYEWDAVAGQFNLQTPIIITDPALLTYQFGTWYPISTVGALGDYAVVFAESATLNPNSSALIYHKNNFGAWVSVESLAWEQSSPAASTNSFAANQPIFYSANNNPACSILVNGINVVLGDTANNVNIAGIASKINTYASALSAAGIIASLSSDGKSIEFYSNRNSISGAGNSAARISITATQQGTNNVTVSSTSNLSVGTKLYINGAIGNLASSTISSGVATGTPYYVTSIVDSTHITLSTALGGSNMILIDATGSSTGYIVDGGIYIVDNVRQGSGAQNTSPLGTLGLTSGTTYFCCTYTEGTFAQIPSWRSSDSVPRPSGSVFLKTSATGNGLNIVLKKYNASSNTWNLVPAPVYDSETSADYGLDPINGGLGIPAGTIFLKTNPNYGNLSSGLTPKVRTAVGKTVVTGRAPTNAATVFNGGDVITIKVSQPAQALPSVYTYTVPGSVGTNNVSVTNFVIGLKNLSIPNFNIDISASGAIVYTHTAGGEILLIDNGSGTAAGSSLFPNGASRTNPIANLTVTTPYYRISNWSNLTYTVSDKEPHTNPADGTVWYYGSALDVDIMINDNGWKGYQNVSSDARGYNLTETDPMGVIASAGAAPKYHSDGLTAVAAGDIWLDTSDLENWPKLSRYNGKAWVAIDNTDQITQNGIVFADARWDTAGTADVINDALPTISDGATGLLFSNYLDLDAPDARLYPRGTLLFNTRRSGYNIKKFHSDYFNAESYPNISLPTVTDAWVSASGLQDNGAMWAGRKAQRNMVVKALAAAVSTNTTVREEQYQFNLIVAPGYPELIPEMVALNNDRANTAFVIGDTPFRLAPDAVSISEWSNNTNGDGLATADPYLGVYYPSAETVDLSGNTIVVPPSHVALRTFIHNDNVSYQWFAPAGTRRGLVDNATNLGYINSTTEEFTLNGVNQGTRDLLYSNKINPIAQIPGIGLVVWGQITRNPTATSLDRVNVARLVNYIRTILARVGDAFLFEPNDKITRNQIRSIINGAINDLIAKRGIYDYVVICDDSNNTPTRIERNELWVDIAIEPMKSVEFIYIPIRLKNPGDIKAGI